ncbi:DUF4829 domain-containing protein [Candidatus Pacearchaeota archaeon]|nr:DUF4829 domain-containing protein [Candidatus Pacearchaeota archaeon]
MLNKKIMYFGLIIIMIIFVLGVIFVTIRNKKLQQESYTFPSPEEVVRQYFTAWNNKDYANMYATFSDGFKKLDPNAKDLATFRNFAALQGIDNINVINIKEISNDGETASVEYSVEFILSEGSKRQFSDKFTLKFRQGDIIQGWKLIHPYGTNVDTS